MLDIVFLVIATSCDSFFMSIAYGSEGIQIPKRSLVMIAFCGTLFLGISLSLASCASSFLTPAMGHLLSFMILFVLGFVNLFQVQMKHYVQKHKQKPLIIRFKGISFVIDIFLDEKQADFDHSKTLSIREAMYLGIALSIDSLASGLAFGMGEHDLRLVLILSFCLGIFVICVGNYIGKHVSSFLSFDVSWLSGSMLMIVAFLRLF